MESFKTFIEEKEKPQPLYVGVHFSESTLKAIKAFIAEAKIQNPVNVDGFHGVHCTLIYSKKPVAGYEKPATVNYTGKVKEFKIFGEENNCLVMVLDSQDLQKRHDQLMKELGASYDFPDYHPHITLSYDCKDFDMKTKVPSIKIVADEEYSEPLDEEWVDTKQSS